MTGKQNDDRQGKSPTNYEDSMRNFWFALIAGVVVLILLGIEMSFWPT